MTCYLTVGFESLRDCVGSEKKISSVCLLLDTSVCITGLGVSAARGIPRGWGMETGIVL